MSTWNKPPVYDNLRKNRGYDGYFQPKLTQREVSTRKTVQGAWECTAMHNNRLTHKQYFGYTKREAVRLFVREVNTNTL